MKQFIFNWGPAIAGLILTGLAMSGCADNLPCNEACTPDMKLAQDEKLGGLVVDLDYDEVFGKEWVAGVNVDGKTATEHFAKKEARK